MPDKEMDDMEELIRAASLSHHPLYDNKAWEKMQVLLDKHLPVKKEKNRFAIFLLLLLFIVGAIFFILLYVLPHGKRMADKNDPAAIPAKAIPANKRPDEKSVRIKNVVFDKNTPVAASSHRNEKEGKDIITSPAPKKDAAGRKSLLTKTGPGIIEALTAPQDTLHKKGNVSITMALQPADEDSAGIAIIPLMPPKPAAAANLQGIQPDSGRTAALTKAVLPQAAKASAKTGKKEIATHFSITLAVAPELSFVGGRGPGKTRLAYGTGLSYALTKRFTLKSGFYVTGKSYLAGPADYHPPKGYWTYNADLQSIQADCRIYEIPIAAAYTFSRSKKHGFFAGIGFSTFFMKSETYNYFYKDAWGRTMSKVWTLLNGSKHYFSVLTVSGGYQYQVNPYFSLSAEPYFKLPLEGIGFGKIKLNSGGLAVTAAIRPFAKRK